MIFKNRELIKFANKLLPRYYPQRWQVKVNSSLYIEFRRMEEALIYEKLLQIEYILKKWLPN